MLNGRRNRARGLAMGLGLALTALSLAGAARAAEIKDEVKIQSGSIKGASAEGGIRAFKGVPFAAPPVGDLRWKAPAPVKPWDGLRDATQFGPACLQPEMKLPVALMKIDQPTGEDCLYLNVWTPAKDTNDKLPVMVWIHGGAYAMGAGSQSLYVGDRLAKRGVVVVSINYRLGPFGFFAHPALTAESEHKASGNYGLMDQIEALKWVKANIAQFGGDPGKVTIFGESAGGGSVFSLLISPLAKDLFQRAIAESGPTMMIKSRTEKRWGYPAMETVGSEMASKLGVEGSGPEAAAALRAKTADEIMKASPGGLVEAEGLSFRRDPMIMAPIVDGYVITEDPMTAFNAGHFNKVPFMVGSNKDEGTMFIMMRPPARDAATYQNFIREGFGSYTDRVLKLHPAETPPQVREGLNSLFADFIFAAPARSIARAVDKTKTPVYLYYFTRVAQSSLGKMMGAHHGSEIPYVFDNLALGATPQNPVNEADQALSEKMAAYWAAFAGAADPNGKDRPEWPRFHISDPETLVLGDEIKAEKDPRGERLDLIDEVMTNWEKLRTEGGA